MKQLYSALLLVVTGTACQHQASPTQAIVAAKVTPLSSTTAQVAEPVPVVSQFLVRHNLASLLQTVTGLESDAGLHIYNGFFGPSHRRIEVVFTQVNRDEARPNLYRVQGKTRYKSIITPFAGTLVFAQVVEQPHYSKKELTEQVSTPTFYFDPAVDKATMYTAVGDFVLREDSTQNNAGIFRGNAALDLCLDPAKGLRIQSRVGRTLTRNGKVKFEGAWTPYGATSPKSVVWVEDIFSYGPQVFNNFTIGERDPDFNPKYAKLGWNTYWTNDEWWTDAFKPSLSL
jgi:hypothetical protein